MIEIENLIYQDFDISIKPYQFVEADMTKLENIGNNYLDFINYLHSNWSKYYNDFVD